MRGSRGEKIRLDEYKNAGQNEDHAKEGIEKEGKSQLSILKHEEQDDVSHSKEEEGVHQVEEEEAVKKASLEA